MVGLLGKIPKSVEGQSVIDVKGLLVEEYKQKLLEGALQRVGGWGVGDGGGQFHES